MELYCVQESSFFFFYWSVDPRDLHSFPTRRSSDLEAGQLLATSLDYEQTLERVARMIVPGLADWCGIEIDRKSTRLNSSHSQSSYAVFCLKKKKTSNQPITLFLYSIICQCSTPPSH